jgi:hypothetical protein
MHWLTLQPEENELIGSWVMRDGRMVSDETETRIKNLIANRLREVSAGNWCKLYVDPTSGAYWELTYPQGEMHGGGPMKLARLPGEEARRRFGV